jgi:hypothetical protein
MNEVSGVDVGEEKQQRWVPVLSLVYRFTTYRRRVGVLMIAGGYTCDLSPRFAQRLNTWENYSVRKSSTSSAVQ